MSSLQGNIQDNRSSLRRRKLVSKTKKKKAAALVYYQGRDTKEVVLGSTTTADRQLVQANQEQARIIEEQTKRIAQLEAQVEAASGEQALEDAWRDKHKQALEEHAQEMEQYRKARDELQHQIESMRRLAEVDRTQWESERQRWQAQVKELQTRIKDYKLLQEKHFALKEQRGRSSRKSTPSSLELASVGDDNSFHSAVSSLTSAAASKTPKKNGLSPPKQRAQTSLTRPLNTTKAATPVSGVANASAVATPAAKKPASILKRPKSEPTKVAATPARKSPFKMTSTSSIPGLTLTRRKPVSFSAKASTPMGTDMLASLAIAPRSSPRSSPAREPSPKRQRRYILQSDSSNSDYDESSSDDDTVDLFPQRRPTGRRR